MPAWIYSAGGTRFQGALPEQQGVKVSPSPAREGCNNAPDKEKLVVVEWCNDEKRQPRFELGLRV